MPKNCGVRADISCTEAEFEMLFQNPVPDLDRLEPPGLSDGFLPSGAQSLEHGLESRRAFFVHTRHLPGCEASDCVCAVSGLRRDLLRWITKMLLTPRED